MPYFREPAADGNNCVASSLLPRFSLRFRPNSCFHLRAVTVLTGMPLTERMPDHKPKPYPADKNQIKAFSQCHDRTVCGLDNGTQTNAVSEPSSAFPKFSSQEMHLQTDLPASFAVFVRINEGTPPGTFC